MNDETIDAVEEETKRKMDSAIESLKDEFRTMHAGRVTPAVLENINVDYYGTPTPISQVGTISTPEPQMLAISPWEKSMLKEIERAILKANMGLSVSNDGNFVRAVMPPLTEDRRKELAKQVKKIGEDCKVAVRNVRRDGNDNLKKLEKDKTISKDEEKASHDRVQAFTDKHIDSISEMVSKKENEVLTI